MDSIYKRISEFEGQLNLDLGYEIKLRLEFTGKNKPDPTKVINAVIAVTKVTETAMKSDSRKREPLYARYYCFLIFNQVLNMKPAEIGDIFCRDRTSIIHALEVIKDLVRLNKYVKEEFSACQLAFIESL